jgi:hypothetical protein
MSYSGYGALGAIGFVVLAGGYNMADRGMNWTAAKGSVFRIDRECGFTREYEGGKQEQIRQDCSATEEFKDISKNAEKRRTDVDGKAVVKVSYISPQDGSTRTSELKFTGRDDEFYKLKAGDELAILVSNEDPAKIRLD